MSPLMLAMASMACPLTGQYELALRNVSAIGHHPASWSKSSKHRQWVSSRDLATSNQTLLPTILWINATTILWAATQLINDDSKHDRSEEKQNRLIVCDCYDYWLQTEFNGNDNDSGERSLSNDRSKDENGNSNNSIWNTYWKFYGRLTMLLVLNCYFSTKTNKK